MFRLFDPERDNPVDALMHMAGLVAMLRDLTPKEPVEPSPDWSPEGLAGLYIYLDMVQQGLRDVANHLQRPPAN